MFLGYIDPGNGTTLSSLGGWILSFILATFGFLFVFFKKGFVFFKQHRRPSIMILTGLFILTLAILGVTMTHKKPCFDKKIIVLGFDGLSPNIMEPMMAEGALPNFQRLKDRGSYQRLPTTNPPQSPVAWAAFATGRNPGENGVYDMIVRDPKTYALRLSLSNIKNNKAARTLKAEPFWIKTSKAKIPTVIIGCPMTFPPDKIYGRMLSGMGVPDILGTEGTFTFYTSGSPDPAKEINGKVFFIKKSPAMLLSLIGPRVVSFGAKTKNSEVPLRAIMEKNKTSVVLEYQGHQFRLETGQWSDWQSVAFEISPIKKIKGIFKFFLVSAEPEFQLYISPIQLDPRDPYYPISYPAGYSKELATKLGLFHTAGFLVDTWAVNQKRLSEHQLLDQAQEVLNERKAVLDFELNRFKNGVLFCYFGAVDTIQHMFWRDDDKNIKRNWYKKLDAILGEVMEKIKESDTLIVLSDHGFGPFRRAVHINTWLRKNGYLALKNPLAYQSRELLQDVDWAQTKAYAISFGAVYINQKGREGKGIVAPGDETQRLKEEIAEKLKGWLDEKDGGRIVHEVYKNEDIFKGPYAANAPDLYVGFNKGYRASWQTALGAAPQDLLNDNLKKWSGDHFFDPSFIPGVFFSNKPIAGEIRSITDIAKQITEPIQKT